MNIDSSLKLDAIASLFDTRADFVNAHPYGSGHINDTFCAYYDQAGLRIRYIHQRINHNVFTDPPALMTNIKRVTEHAQALLSEGNHPEAFRRTLSLIPAISGEPYAQDSTGNYWRTYPFIERARTYDQIQSTDQAEAAAKAFGEFQKHAATLPGERLTETIPSFHHTPKRYERLLEAIANDKVNRAGSVKEEILFVEKRVQDCSRVVKLMESGEIPERVTHNDTKLNNVMIDDVSGEGICVIDLDTVMPGSVLYDFGDMVRTATPATAEDEVDTSKIHMQMPMFEALLRGYLDSARAFLNDAEIQHLAFSGKLLSLECGIRFLTDHLEGDHYFKIKRKNHNLDRCRSQFALVKSIESQQSEMETLVSKYIYNSKPANAL
ncbi:aminoglycoside phosphotransferase family protein [Rubellicoccus peritrichatus]|uniref:Aminoglycoside phosphotransferase family protein n=1 Tax=Rubellicoccus peritrichatus TaxID=3080537 RepID=A0AAQ3L7Y1_9BACT|nr:aminoglycoside phosphotransferase family protein [Puniceicoccus sp. CR14]WOO40716.1 aminoglycoside phosphotransferase family protein [Puniceicoccus sp. CR14]